MEQLEVIASFDWLKEEEIIGVLGCENNKGEDIFSFEFSKDWLRNHPDIILDRDLHPWTGVQYIKNNLFGCFNDCLPDYWGKLLIELKERQGNKDFIRPTFNLSEWTYLKGVDDFQRVGALRFKSLQTGEYLNADDTYKTPPLVDLKDIVKMSRKVEKDEFEQRNLANRWNERLLRPGTSVGGARPKACVIDNGELYIAKFPSEFDKDNDTRWEYFTNKLAKECGITTADVKLFALSKNTDIFLSKRFDRTADGKRIHMSTAKNLLCTAENRENNVLRSYTDIADLIVENGTDVEKSLQELYRRVAFSICIGNADDHLKNHSFLLTEKGWKLSPVYDINPSYFYNHCLLIDNASNESSLDNLYNAHKLYKLDEDTAYVIIKDVTRNIKYWEEIAGDCGISDLQMDRYKERFENGISWKYNETLKR